MDLLPIRRGPAAEAPGYGAHGHGFVATDVTADEQRLEGNGMRTMRERTEELGGTLVIESMPGDGTTVVATIPAPDEHPETQETTKSPVTPTLGQPR